MAPKSILVTGANRGIGLGIIKELLKNKEIEVVFAGCRTPEKADELNALKSDSRLHVIAMDVDSDESIQKAYETISGVVGEHGLTVLLNNAGILLPYDVEDKPDRQKILNQLETNSVSLAIVTQIFLPLLKKSAAIVVGDQYSIDRSAIINISSAGASIHLINGTFNGPYLAYRMSKSAVNSFAKTISIDLAKYHILVTSFCPGWVQTDMGGANADLTINESCKELVGNILKLNGDHHGAFLDRSLKVIPN